MYNWFAQKRSMGFLMKTLLTHQNGQNFRCAACKCPSGGTCSRRKFANSPAAQEVILIRYDLNTCIPSRISVSDLRSGSLVPGPGMLAVLNT